MILVKTLIFPRQIKQTYVQGNVIARKFYMYTENVKIKLFNTYCNNMYTAHLWWKHTKASIRSMHVAYNNVFRLLFDLDRRCSASEMFALRRVDSCQSILRKAMYSFVVRLKKSQNGIIRNLLESDLIFQSGLSKYWLRSLISPSFDI